MELERIKKNLENRFSADLKAGEKRKIIFWYDTEGQFADLIEELQLENAKLHRLMDSNYFCTKYLLEVEDTESNYLIYANNRPARDEDNWLIDIMLYSYEFFADRLALQMEELGINRNLKPLVKDYQKFFNSRERRKKLAGYGIADYDEAGLELAMMSVLCALKYPDQLQVFKKVLGTKLEEENNRYFTEISRFMDSQVFWKHANRYFGYTREENSLQKLASHILINSLSRVLDDNQLSPLKEYLSPQGKANCIFFVDNWMNHQGDKKAYEQLAVSIERFLNIAERLDSVSISSLGECDIFEAFDKKVLNYIMESIHNEIQNYEQCLGLIETRRNKHWYEKYQSIYEAIYYLIKILQYHQKHPDISGLNIQQLWEQYTSDYYQLDYYYRLFYWYYDQNPVEALKPLRIRVENIYSNWFLEGLGTVWSAAIDNYTGGELKIDGVTSQQDFYQRELAPLIGSGERCFVIISDALRYEAAVDIVGRLNAETAGKAKMDTMMGVLPSATKYGMVALLPHQDISLENERVMADGNRTDSLQEREKILKKHVSEAVATHYKNIIAMGKEERRELVKGKKLIYIYHDYIDAIGHPAATEIKVFDAVQQTEQEIYRLIRIIRDDLGGVNIYLTADHGFLYKRDPLVESDKIKKETLGAVEESRRHMLSYQEVESDALLKFKPEYLKSPLGQPVVYVPRAAIRFKVQGAGANFVHGGASLQELVIPLIKYKAGRGSNLKKKEASKVKVKLLNESHKITNNLFSLDFFQTEKVDDRNIPRTVVVFIEDEKGKVLSNRETIIADKTSDKASDRTYKVRLTLQTGKYDKNKDYFLIIKDVETDLIEDRIPFQINLAISLDFDF